MTDKHYKDPVTSGLYGYPADGSLDEHIPKGFILLTEEELKIELSKQVVPIPTGNDAIPYLKGHRDILLSQSDWTQMPDSPLSKAQKDAWVVYRQALRDLTSQPKYPTTITWPVKP